MIASGDEFIASINGIKIYNSRTTPLFLNLELDVPWVLTIASFFLNNVSTENAFFYNSVYVIQKSF